MRPLENRRFAALLPSLAPVAVVFAAVFALSGCELAYHQLSAERQAGCTPWSVGCQPVVDVAGEGPIQTTRHDMKRVQIVDAAAHAPYRQCDTLAFGCQLIIAVDALDEQYVQPFGTDPY